MAEIGPSRGFLTIEVGVAVYGLAVAPDGFDLCKPSGESYRVSRGEHGPVCECRDFAVRHAGLMTGGCKHVRALRDAGLLRFLAPPMPPSPANEEDDARDAMIALGILPVSGGSPESTTTDEEKTMNAEARNRVIEIAKHDAALFVEEFGEPLDPAEGDWDGTAWADAEREVRTAYNLTHEETDELWPVYQEALVAETERLTS